MEKLNVNFASKTIEIAEEENYLLLTNRVCYLSEPNGNGVCLPYDDPTAAEEMTKTLIDMPVVAKYVCGDDGEPNLGGHEAYIDEETGEIAFATTPIGVHTDAYIKEDTVTTYAGETKKLPCVFAVQKIWKRNKNMVAAVRRLFAEGHLHNSWELASTEYRFRDGIKYLTKYSYLGNCFLGDNVPPAFGASAQILSLSQEDNNAVMMVAEALAQDIAAGGKENEMDEKIIISETPIVAEEPEVVVESADETAPADETVAEVTEVKEADVEISELTIVDIRARITNKLRGRNEWGWIVYVYPEDHYVLWHECEMDELTFVKYNYTVNGDDVEVDEGEEVKLTVSIAEINAKVSELNEVIANLNAEIEKLSPYRDAYEKAEAERLAAEHKAAVAELRQHCLDSGRFDEAELAGEDMAALLEALDRNAINTMIAERVVAESRNRKAEPEVVASSSMKLTLEAEEPQDLVGAFRSFLSM